MKRLLNRGAKPEQAQNYLCLMALNLDEFFYIVDGRFLIDLEDRTIDLRSRQGFVVPRGVIHRTRAPERAVILMVEGADIIPTGD